MINCAYLDNYKQISIAGSQNLTCETIQNFTLVRIDKILTLDKLDYDSSYYFDHALEIIQFQVFEIANNIPDLDDAKCFSLVTAVDLDLNFDYLLLETKALSFDRSANQIIAVNPRFIVHTQRFDQEFGYSNHDLGSLYTKVNTTFKLWAPTTTKACLILFDEIGQSSVYEMSRGDRGVFSIQIAKDLKNYSYIYELQRSGGIRFQTVDPYAMTSLKDASASQIIDLSELNREIITPASDFPHQNDAIIYEVSIRDLTISSTSQTQIKGKFNSLLETETNIFGNPTAFNYLQNLGITHLQFLPVLDFDSYPEDSYYESYNWGYDPKQFNVVEGSYLCNNYGVAKINELRTLVNHCHRHNLRVNLDVVFNHVGNPASFAFELILPYYAYRYYENGYMANGSFCGNELRTEALMLQNYFIDMCRRYIDLFDIDGLRFDLCGLIDRNTMTEIVKMTRALKPNFMIYGEGWDMPSPLPYEQKTIINNCHLIPDVAFFNPEFRDIIKGKSMDDQKYDCGFAMGNIALKEASKQVLLGSFNNGRAIEPSQTINYLVCHDNFTLYDKMTFALQGADLYHFRRIAKLNLGLLLVSQGIVFIHCGQEFLRTKKGVSNSYKSPDDINAIDWYDTIRYKDIVSYCQELIRLRKRYQQFRLPSRQDIISRCHFSEYYELLIYQIDNIKVYINASQFDHKYPLTVPETCIFDNRAVDIEIEDYLSIPAYSLVITKL